MRGILEVRAAARPFALPDGSTVREVVTKRETVRDADAVRRALVDLGGETLAIDAVETTFKTSKSAIEKACKTNGVDPKVALRVLRERGALATSESSGVEAVK